MITSKTELKFYMMADNIMNRGRSGIALKDRLKQLIAPDYIMDYLHILRKCEYYLHAGGGIDNTIKSLYYRWRHKTMGVKLGFSIAYDVFGYGLVIPHYGTIVVGSGNVIGNYCVIHTSTCITTGKKVIGNAFYLSTGSKVIHDDFIADNISVGANSLVNKSFLQSNRMIAGNPAVEIKESDPWFIRDGKEYERRVAECEELRARLCLEDIQK